MNLKDFKDYGIENILQSEFGFQPKKTKLKYYKETNWKNQFKNESVGIFHPRTLTAHVKLNPLDTLILRVIHEYFGHGSYCEYTINGKLIVEYEKRLSELEEDLVGEKLPENLRVSIVEGKKFSLNKTENSEFDYILTVDKENVILQEYINLQKEYKQFFEDNLLTYEGFAVWLEGFLLKKLKQEKIWSIREEEIKDSIYQSFYQEFKKFEQENGLLSLIYQTGFPRIRSKEFVKRLANEHLNLDELSFLILYGSKRDYGDIDLLAVYRDEVSENCNTDYLDVVSITKSDFVNRLKLFDVGFTEILFTGELILGNLNNLETLKKKIVNQPFCENASNHLKQKSMEALDYAKTCYNEGILRNNRELFVSSLCNLSYAWSYNLINKELLHNHRIFTLSKILELEKSEELNQIFEYLRKIKRNFYIPKKNEIKDFLDKTGYILY